MRLHTGMGDGRPSRRPRPRHHDRPPHLARAGAGPHRAGPPRARGESAGSRRQGARGVRAHALRRGPRGHAPASPGTGAGPFAGGRRPWPWRWRSRRGPALHSEPAWRPSGAEGGPDPAFSTLFKRSPDLPASSSRPRDGAEGGARLAVERQTLDVRDENTALVLSAHRLADHTPEKAVVPSLVRVSDPSTLVSARARAELVRRGFEVRTAPGTPHAVHRDRFDAFVDSLSGWL